MTTKKTDPESKIEPTSPGTYPIWLGFAEKRPTQRGTLRIRLRWPRILAAMVILMSLGWLGKSAAFYYFFSEIRDFEEVRFSDMLVFPMNRAVIRVQQGDYQVQKGLEAVERQDFGRALSLLREGVARSPKNLEGRLMLARIYTGWRPDLSIQILEDGLEDGRENQEFIQLLTNLLIQNKEDEKLLEITADLLKDSTSEIITRSLAASRLSVAIARGKFKLAEEIFKETNIKDSLDGILLGSDLYNRLGQTDKSKSLLRSVIATFPDEPLEVVYRRLIQIHRELDELGEARELALEMSLKSPEAWQPRILLAEILEDSGMEERRNREMMAILRQHRNDEAAMIALGQLTANQGNAEIASRLYELALENDFSLGVFSLILVEAHVNASQFERAISLADELVRESPSWLPQVESTFNGIRSIAYFGLENPELGNLYLTNFVKSRQTTVSQLVQAANSYLDFGLKDGALTLLMEAHTRDDSNERVLAELIQLQMDLGTSYKLDEHIRQLFDLRRPAYENVEQIAASLASDRFIYTVNRGGLIRQLEQIAQEREGIEIEIWQPRSLESTDAPVPG